MVMISYKLFTNSPKLVKTNVIIVKHDPRSVVLTPESTKSKQIHPVNFPP